VIFLTQDVLIDFLSEPALAGGTVCLYFVSQIDGGMVHHSALKEFVS